MTRPPLRVLTPLAALALAVLALAACDSGGNPTSFDVEIALTPYGTNPATQADVMFVAPGAAGPGRDTLRIGTVRLPWRYKDRDLGMGQYTLEACVVGRGIVEAHLDVSDGYQGFITHGFGSDFSPDLTSPGSCARGSFRVSDRTETPPWEQ